MAKRRLRVQRLEVEAIEMNRRYRKKPIVVQAYKTEVALDIDTLEGTMRANVGDWIIKGIRGEVYPCKPDIFAATYERADSDTNAE